MLNKKALILTLICLVLLTSAVQAQEFKTPESFTAYIYSNYAAENFEEVYSNFAAELKRRLKLKSYVEFQTTNFDKYNLKYTEIEVAKAEKIEFEQIKKKFDYAKDFGNYYKLKVNYLLKFDRLGSREEESDKFVYLRKIKDDFQIFWDYQKALKNKKAVNDDQND